MQDNLEVISEIIKQVLINENPDSVLEISGYDSLLRDLIYKHSSDVQTDRIDLTDSLSETDLIKYNEVHLSNSLTNIDELDNYDVIIICHLFENIAAEEALVILEKLLAKVNKCILVLTPLYPYDLSSDEGISTVRTYHPVFFLGFEFSYKQFDNLQAYIFFPKIDYPHLPCDDTAVDTGSTITDISGAAEDIGITPEKMKLAFILPHRGLTGAVKAMMQQMKELAANGHTVNLYFRSDETDSAIPEWSHLTAKDVTNQIIIPANADINDYFTDEQAVVLGFVNQLNEYYDLKLPVVLWEQGSPAIYGDHGKLIGSKSNERYVLHAFYRRPVHLLAVSYTIKTVLSGVFNRIAQLFPVGIDTEFYHPALQKNNEIPVILLVGSYALEFKGFAFAIAALSNSVKYGIPFKVKWASQVDIPYETDLFEIEKYIMPTQKVLAELYRTSDILLSTSLYESFPLPPIEAMASGTAVIATDNGGIQTYAEPGENCILCEQGDLYSMSFAIGSLLANPEARDNLARAGRETALKYSFKNVIKQLEISLHKVIKSV